MNRNDQNRIVILILVLSVWLFASRRVMAAPSLVGVNPGQFEGPAHHGLSLEITPLQDPTLTAFEVHVKEDKPGPAPWNVYSTHLYPADVSTINLTYRNGIYSLVGGKTYCIKIRGVFGDKVSEWSQKCGITIPLTINDGQDSDGDGVTDGDEYNLGSDPHNKDSDQDGYTDGEEVSGNLDINEVKYPNLEILTPGIDFGMGDPSGQKPNQHAFVELRNTGLEPATIINIEIKNANPPGVENYFEIGPYPKSLSYIPPHNQIKIPVTFLPKGRGDFLALLSISVPGNPKELKPVTLKGTGSGIPDCQVSPDILDFGTVKVSDQTALVKYFTVANKPEVNSPLPKNMDTDFGFTVSTTNTAMAPGIRGTILPPGGEIKIPVLFQHPHKGNFDSQLEVHSFACGIQKIELKGTAE